MIAETTFEIAPAFIAVIIILSVWSIIWKGFALWHAARLGHKRWFVVLLIVNTVGILEILYLVFVVRKKKQSGELS